MKFSTVADARHLSQKCIDVARLTVRLVLPVECPGCGLLDVLLCTACHDVLHSPATQIQLMDHSIAKELETYLRDQPGEAFPLWALGHYTSPLRGIILAWKYGGRRDLAPLVQEAAAVAVLPLREALGSVDQVIAVPSTPQAIRRRGGLRTAEIARAIAVILGASSDPVLSRSRRSHDQVGLGRRQRIANVRGQFSVRSKVSVANKRVLLVDDIVTTGSTLGESARMLRHAHATIVGAIVLAAPDAAPEPLEEYPQGPKVE